VERAHLKLPTAPGFGIEIDTAKVDSQKVLNWE
jgi:L-alanine-DL-glutamate epimerase-like enolase superfamily enzyme